MNRSARYVLQDTLCAFPVLLGLLCLDIFIVMHAMDWLHAHGLGMHTPDSGPLHDEYLKLANGISGILILAVGLFTLAPLVWWCDRRKIHMWNPSRPWNQRLASKQTPGL